MGIWKGLRSIAGKAMNRDRSDMSSYSNRVPPGQAVAKISFTVGAQKLPHHRDNISPILTGLGKFAVDSAVNDSLKGVTGGIRVYKTVKEKLKDQSSLPATNENKKPEHSLVMQEMQANMEKMQEEMSFIKQRNGASMKHANELNSSKESSAEANEASAPLNSSKESSAEANEASAPLNAGAKKVFIRSRL